ncbi:MAG: hypothetical protein H7070_10185 [Saprospiraceae bacterium]|nr:hypothetical protein [Pyrinomonadaceae bacterium]
MAERTSSLGSKSALSKILSQERISGSDRELAVTHEINRQSVVKELLVRIFLMSKFKILAQGMSVHAATTQYFRSSADDNEQAAHCAPGQLRYNGQDIQNLLPDDLRRPLEDLFGKTDGFPSRFNIADSRAEENGLKNALCNACNHAARSGSTARFNRAFEFYPHIDAAFNVYKMEGITAFQAAIAKQRILMLSLPDNNRASRQEWISILECYLDTLAGSANTLETVQGLFPEDLWRQHSKLA